MDTIFATATAPGRAGISVVRISGPMALQAGMQIAGSLPDHGRCLRRLRAADGTVIDEALVLTFAKGRSFTGEAVVELHLHGSRAVVNAVLDVLASIDGLRGAQAGEFTRRAVENGHLDIAQAEGLADLLDAETEAQRQQAMRVFSGGLRVLCEGWRADLLRSAALLEATIDFADEDVPVDVGPEVLDLLRGVRTGLTREAAGVTVAERVRSGFEVALVGRPNVGKSTLLNHLVGRDVAITSELAGTTRDVIEVTVDIGGLAVTFLDTAGQREGLDEIEKIGIARGEARAAQADVRVVLLEDVAAPRSAVAEDDIVLIGKMDDQGEDGVGISGRTGAGVDWLLRRISEILAMRVATVGTATTERHRFAMVRAVQYLDGVVIALESGVSDVEFLAADLRAGLREIDGLIGRVDVEDVLGEIFSRFCIGK